MIWKLSFVEGSLPECLLWGSSAQDPGSEPALAGQVSTPHQLFCLLSMYPTLLHTLSPMVIISSLSPCSQTRMLNRSRESAWRDMASNQRCFILIQIRAILHAMQSTSLHYQYINSYSRTISVAATNTSPRTFSSTHRTGTKVRKYGSV